MVLVPTGKRARGLFGATAAALAAVLGLSLLTPVAAAADDLVFALIEVSKTADPAAPTALAPGEQVTFDIEVSCSSTQTDCISMQLSDAMPDPLTLVSVSPSSDYTVAVSGDSFIATFNNTLDVGGVGLRAGELVAIQVIAAVPLDTDASFNGQTITNTAYVTVDNPDSNVQDDADVLLTVPLDLKSSVAKTVTPASVVGFPGTTVDFNVTAANTSNTAVDSLIVEDPAEPASNAFDYLAVTALDNVVFPSGSDRVQVDWMDALGNWTAGSPSASATLPPDPSLIKGLRVTFSNSGSGKIAVGASGSFRIRTLTTSAVASLSSDFTGSNLVSSQVWLGVDSNTPVLHAAPFTITGAAIAPGADKDITPGVIIGGQPTTVTVGGSNGGDFTIGRMTITEPKPGTLSMADQGIGFESWTDDIEWPLGATSASVSYLYETTGLGAPVATTTLDTLPEPTPGEAVLGFIVEFTGTMAPGAYAVLPFEASTSVTVATDITTTDTVTVEVETLTGETATADATDDLIRRASRVNTNTRKIITPSTIYASPGTRVLLSLPSEVAPLPPAAVNSTIGATALVVRDDDPAFWDLFDATSVVATDVPANSLLTVRSFDGTTWTNVPGAIAVAGPATLSVPLPAGAEGVEFSYTPLAPSTILPPGFEVQPNVRATLRSTNRSGGPIVPPAATDPVVLANTVFAEVTNPVATPPFASANASDSIDVLPLGSGPGPDGGPALIAKHWQRDEVLARSAEQAAVDLKWGTGGLQYPSVVVADSAVDPGATGWDVADTVFEAFDLVSIPAITPSMDPLLVYDAIDSVEFYLDGDGWTPAVGNPCAGTACYGTFPGYTLTQDERDRALGVRFVFVERPNRPAPTSSNPTAPDQGTGVAASVFAERRLDLVFAIRDQRRSDPALAVLGITRGSLYNTVDAGQVLNDAWVGLRDSAEDVVLEDTASDTILILDRPLGVEATKVWMDGPLGIPPAGTDAEYYPTARMVMTARNTSVIRVNELSLAEPTGGTSPFDTFNLSRIVGITVPAGAMDTDVILLHGSTPATYTRTAALALNEAQLADVTGIEVVHTGRIASNEVTTVTLDTRLRELLRGTADPVIAGTVDNTTTATVRDPSGTSGPPEVDNVLNAIASDDMVIQAWQYGVVGTKSIAADTTANVGSPAIQYEDSSRNARITLTGQPTGNVRTTKMVFEDSTPSFWNAFNFESFGPGSTAPVTPADRVQVDALVGVDYVVGAGNTITAECNGSTDLTDCWVLGTPASALTLPSLGATAVAEIRGLRFTYIRADGANWERPFNPTQVVRFTVERRDTLVTSGAVPSTLHGLPPAPGEPVEGTYTNAMTVTASGGDISDSTPLWSASDDDFKELKFQHLPARVEIKKTPYGAQSLGVDIPYQISVLNRGGAHEKVLGDVVITDTLPVDADGAQLVIPNDPDTGMPYPVADAFTYTLLNDSNQVQPAPTVTAVLGPATIPAQTLTFTLVSPSTLPKGWTLRINATMQLRPQLSTGINVLNTATVTADQLFDTCDSYTDVSTQNPQTTFVDDCTSTTQVWALPSAPLTVVKGVRGVAAGPLDGNGDPLLDGGGDPYDDLGILKTVPASSVNCTAPNVATGATAEYYRYPCVPITRPGGTEEWAATFVNGGNISVVKLAAIDVLPRGGDRGVIVNEARSSKWTPLLSSLPTLIGGPADAALAVYYETSTAAVATRCNATDIQDELGMTASSVPPVSNPTCLTGSAAEDLPQRNWQLLTQTVIDNDPASVVALKFVITSATGIQPGQKFSIVYRSTTAAAPEIAESATGLDRDTIAWNSIGAAALGDDNGTLTPNRFVIEPRKVGVAMATGGVELQKVVDGLNAGASYLEDDFELNLTCTSAGESFDLKHSDGSLRNPFVVTGGSTALIQGLPLYAKCDVSEANYGAVTSISPVTVTAQAAHSTAHLVYDPHPAFDSSRPAIERSVVTNTYNLASLVVGKTIGANPAVNQNGATIGYSSFRFRVDCTYFNGVGTVTVLDNLTFSLDDGATRTITGLPEGAECTVQETNDRGAVANSHVVTTGSTVTGPTTGSVTMLVLEADGPGATPANSVQFTNDFGEGALTINKLFAGLAHATYGTADFTVTVNCTYNTGGGSVNVWSGSFVLNKTVTSHTIQHLAVGASCVITEPGRGGATSVTVPSNATIGNGTTVVRNVTNTFDYAQLVVTKNVVTDAEDSSGDSVILDSPFQVLVNCTFNGGPVYAAGYGAGSPMQFTLTHGASQTLTQLPSGASCTVMETTPANADSTDIRWTTTSNPGGTTAVGTTATFTLTRDVSGAATNTAIINNRYGVGSFTVTKELKGGASTQFGTGPFVIHVECIAPGGITAYDDDVVLSPATTMSVTIGNLAKDSVCSAEETNFAATGADARVYRDGDGNVFDGTGINITDDVPAVTVENWYLTGAVEVEKSVTGAAAGVFGDGPFEVTLTCTLDGVSVNVTDPVRTILDGETETFTHLPHGAECLLRETDTGGASTSLIVRTGSVDVEQAVTGWSFTVDDIDISDLSDNQPQAGFEVQNTFQLAQLAVSKDVVSDARDQDGDPIGYGPFPVTVDCLFNGDPVFAAGYSALVPMHKSLTAAETWLLEALPQGAACTVTETDSRDAVSPSIELVAGSATPATVSGTTATITLAGLPASNTAEITNPYEIGELELSKVVDGAGASAWGTEPFTIRVDCTLTDGSGARNVWLEDYEFQVVGGVLTPASVTIDTLAAGASCAITETRTGGANLVTVTVDGSASPGTSAVATIPPDDTAEVVVTNTFQLTEVDVDKVRVGLGAALYGDGPFEVTLVCERDIDGTAHSVAIPGGATRWLTATSLPVAFVANYSGLPVGAECELTETQTGGADLAPVVTPGNFTLVPTANDVTVTNTFGDPSVIVRKALSGAGVALYGAGPFEVTLQCTREVNGATVPVVIPGGPTRELNSLNGYQNQFDNLPSYADCELTETTTAGATSATITNPVFTLGDANTQHDVDLDNTFELSDLRVTKQVVGTNAVANAGKIFTVELACTLDRDGTPDPISIPGGAIRTVQDGNEVLYEDLPAASECVLTETDDGGANGLIMSHNSVPVLGSTVLLSPGLSTLALVNIFMLVNTGSDPLSLALFAALLMSGGAALVFGGLLRRRGRGGALR